MKKNTNKIKTYTLRLTENDLIEIKKNADQYFAGNMSAWVRYSAINLKPKKSNLNNIHKSMKT